MEFTADQNLRQLSGEARSTTAEGLNQNYSQDLGKARGLLNSGDGGFNDRLGYDNKVVRDAIKSKYNQDFAQSEKKIKLQNMMNANEDQLKRLSVASNMANEEVATNQRKWELKQKMDQQRRAARAQMVGAVLGIAGGIAGGVVTGGSPMGIMAGAQLGQGVGQVAGG